MHKRTLTAAALTGAILLASSCGSSGDAPSNPSSGGTTSSFDEPFTDVDAYPLVVSTELIVGSNRVLIAMFDKNDAPTGSPATKMHVAFYDLAKSESQPVSEADAQWVWAVPGERGLWEVPDVRFDSTGKWGASVDVHGGGLDEHDLRVSFEVEQDATTPAIGAPAPASDTPTSRDVKDLADITSDPHPDPRFYETSVADAVKRHEPFVLVFATPKYCTSRVCGPTLDVVKRMSKGFPDITFIHVEVYDLSDPSKLKTVPAVKQWGLPGEPWVFVVDSRGDVAAKYEGAVSPPELRAVLERLR